MQITQREFQLTEDFTAPKGALLMPSLIAASMQVGCLCHAIRCILYAPRRHGTTADGDAQAPGSLAVVILRFAM